MRPYETMVIFDTSADETAIQGVLDRAQEIVRANGGNPGAVERWGKRAFAYELRHKREGYYVLFELTAEPVATSELDRMLGLADEVLRHKIIRLPDKVAGRRRAEQEKRASSSASGSSGRSTPAAAAPAAPATEAADAAPAADESN